MSEDVAVTYSERGFVQYTPIHCTYGTKTRIYGSSAAMGPHVWLNVDTAGSNIENQGEAKDAVAHLNLQGAQTLVDQLQHWIAEAKIAWEIDE